MKEDRRQYIQSLGSNAMKLFKSQLDRIKLRVALKQSDYDTLDSFDESIFTESIIDNNFDVICDYFLKRFYETKNNLKNNKYFLEKILNSNKPNTEKYWLVFDFDESVFTESIVENNFDNILTIIGDNTIPPNLIHNSFFQKKIFESSNFDDIIEKHKNIFISCLNNNNIPKNMADNDKLLKCILESDKISIERKYNLIEQFSSFLFTKDLIEERSELFLNLIQSQNGYEHIPKNLRKTPFLINIIYNSNKINEDDKISLISEFDGSIIPDDIIISHKDEFINLCQYVVPENLRKNKALLNIILESREIKSKSNLIRYFDSSSFTQEIIEKYESVILDICQYNFPENLKSNIFLFNLIINSDKTNKIELCSKFSEGIILENYDLLVKNLEADHSKILYFKEHKEFISQLLKDKNKLVLLLPFHENILNDEEILNKYSELLEITPDDLKDKLNKLLKINDEVLDTILPALLDNKFSVLSLSMIERLSVYPDIQEKLFDLEDNDLDVIIKVINSCENEQIDINGLIYRIIKNLDSHKELLNNIGNSEFSEEEMKNLIFVLQRKDNFFDINKKEDLVEEKFHEKLKEKFLEIEDKIKTNSSDLDIETLRSALIEKVFGIDIESAKFINIRYCTNIEEKIDLSDIEDSKLDFSTRLLLQEINEIFSCSSISDLKFLFLNSDGLRTDYTATIDLEAKIRSSYTRLYSDSLYKIKETDRLKKTDFKNQEMYFRLSEISVKGQKPVFYVAHDDFNMQIHVLGAYRYFERPVNFKNDWDRPKISDHGICTSFISNEEIANARQYHPAYGFSHLEDSAILKAGNYDLGSNNTNFATSIYDSGGVNSRFYTPQNMIDKTRHTHNEIVIERRGVSAEKDSVEKRQPDYIVYMVDDINNEENFDSEKNTLFSETIQAAVDNNIPIVIVDRLQYAKSEREKCEELSKEFEKTEDFTYLQRLLTKICNNMVGCKKYDEQDDKEYHHYFDADYLKSVLDREIGFISELDPETKDKLYEELRKFSETESFDLSEIAPNINKNIIKEIIVEKEESRKRKQEFKIKDEQENKRNDELKMMIEDSQEDTIDKAQQLV